MDDLTPVSNTRPHLVVDDYGTQVSGGAPPRVIDNYGVLVADEPDWGEVCIVLACRKCGTPAIFPANNIPACCEKCTRPIRMAVA